jgi:hypothetical protein
MLHFQIEKRQLGWISLRHFKIYVSSQITNNYSSSNKESAMKIKLKDGILNILDINSMATSM